MASDISEYLPLYSTIHSQLETFPLLVAVTLGFWTLQIGGPTQNIQMT